MTSFGECFLALRTALKYSQREMAEILHTIHTAADDPPIESIQHWENNRRQPRKREELVALVAKCRALNPRAVTPELVIRLFNAYRANRSTGRPLELGEWQTIFPNLPYPDPEIGKPSLPDLDEHPTQPLAAQPTERVGGPHPERNPFIVGPPITDPGQFFGRIYELRRLFDLLRKQPLQSGAIIGPRHSGKTSLLYYLSHITTAPPEQLRPGQNTAWIPHPERYHWVYIDFRDPQMGDVAGLLREILTHIDLPVPDPCNMTTFTTLVRQELHTPTVIMFDEIGVALQHYPSLDYFFWGGLRALAHNHVKGNLAFILTSHKPFAQIAQNEVAGSPFFTTFGYVAPLGPLQEAEARELIASSPIPFPPADVDWILAHSSCDPTRLQFLCRERLLALEAGDHDSGWQAEGLHQIQMLL